MLKNLKFEKVTKDDIEGIFHIYNHRDNIDASFRNKTVSFDKHEAWWLKALEEEYFHQYVLRDNGKITGVVSGTDFNISEGYCFWNLGIDTTLQSDLKYGSILKYLLFEELFCISGLLEIRAKVLKHLRWIVEWHFRWGFKELEFNEKDGFYVLSLHKEDWNSIKNKIRKDDLGGALD